MQISRTFKALKRCFQIPGLSRTLKDRTNPEVHTEVYTHMTSAELWMTLDDLENTDRQFVLKWSLYPQSFKFIRKFILYMTSDDLENTPQMTLKIPLENLA